MNTEPHPLLLFSLPDRTQRLASLLQREILIPCPGTVQLESLLLNLPGCDRDYISTRVETIFVNGNAVDSLAEPLAPGMTVALSAAMPGLAGAIFRKGGLHKSLRSRPSSTRTVNPDEGYVSIRLFNQVAADLAEPLLTRGVLMRGPALARFVRNRAGQLLKDGGAITLDSQPVTGNDAKQRPASFPQVLVRSTFISIPARS